MRLSQVTIAVSQADLERAVNQWMPEGYEVRHVHITSGGVFATLVAPILQADLELRVYQQTAAFAAVAATSEIGLAQDSPLQNALDSGVIEVEVRLKKWIPVPKSMIAHVLNKLIGQDKMGLSVSGQVVGIDMHSLMRPWIEAESLSLTTEDGVLVVQGTGVSPKMGPVIDEEWTAG